MFCATDSDAEFVTCIQPRGESLHYPPDQIIKFLGIHSNNQVSIKLLILTENRTRENLGQTRLWKYIQRITVWICPQSVPRKICWNNLFYLNTRTTQLCSFSFVVSLCELLKQHNFLSKVWKQFHLGHAAVSVKIYLLPRHKLIICSHASFCT